MTEKTPVMLRLQKELHEKLKAVAKQERRSVNNLLEIIIEDYIRSYTTSDKE